MRRFFAALVLALAACVPTHRPQTPHTTSAADLERKTVALVRSGLEGPQAYCTGVWVGEDLIVTSQHCVEERDVVSYVTRDDVLADDEDEVEAIRRGVVVARDEDHDLALIRAKLPPVHDTALVGTDTGAGVAPIVGQNVQTMGNPLGQWWSYSTGQVSALRVMAVNGLTSMWFVQTTAPISPGNSGGGLFDDDGNLIGIAHAYMPRGENLNFFIHAKYVAALLKR